MAILLLILKIIGITLLVILGLILFLILMVLFYPVGYRVRGEWQEDLKVRVTVGWLLSVVHAGVSYDNNETRAVVRLFGIPIMRIPRPEKVRKPKRTKKPKKVTAVVPVEPQKKVLLEDTDLEYNKKDEPVVTEAPAQISEQENTGFTGKKKSLSAKLCRIIEKIRGIIEKFSGIGEKFRGVKEKIRSIKSQIHQIFEMIRNEGNKSAVKLVWKELVGLLKRYRPRKVKADVNYCMADPARTGQVLGGLAMLPFLYTQKVSIVPDFESEEFYVNGSWDIKGHIQVLPLLMAGIRIYKNQDVKKLIKQLREREED